jgi:hypothetical protein
VTRHEHIALVDSVAVVQRAEGTYATPMSAGYHLATRHAATLMPADEYATLANQHAPWAPDQTVTEGSKRAHAGLLYECVQAHTTQADWAPDLTPALWRMIPAENVIRPWAQPQGAHDAYNKGDRVTYQGTVYESTVDANVYAPTVVDGQWVVVE